MGENKKRDTSEEAARHTPRVEGRWSVRALELFTRTFSRRHNHSIIPPWMWTGPQRPGTWHHLPGPRRFALAKKSTDGMIKSRMCSNPSLSTDNDFTDCTNPSKLCDEQEGTWNYYILDWLSRDRQELAELDSTSRSKMITEAHCSHTGVFVRITIKIVFSRPWPSHSPKVCLQSKRRPAVLQCDGGCKRPGCLSRPCNPPARPPSLCR